MKVLVITGNELRHRFFVQNLSKRVNVVGAIFEKKANVHENKDFGDAGNRTVSNHFQKRAESEIKYFQQSVQTEKYSEINNLELPHGDANNDESFEWINSLKPNIIQLFGSSLIKNHILEKYLNKVVNLHLGLSPYYRGSGTNFWPLVHKKPECVGATIHLAVKKVDAGNILHQYRPKIELSDTIHDIGNKIIEQSASILSSVLLAYYKNIITPKSQNLNIGTVCFRKDLSSDSIDIMYENFQNGMIQNYLTHQSKRDLEYPIIDSGVIKY
jgi:methionyl-tRNA formyltransferase